MITMRTSVEPLNIIAMGKKIVKVNSVVPRHVQWLLYKFALVISDILMTGLAFRLAYFFRFETNLSLFAEDAVISLKYYKMLVVLS